MAKLQTAKLGNFGIYPQVDLGADPGIQEYYWFRGNLFDVAPQQQVRDLGDLVGGGLLPGGQVKTGIFSGGRAIMPPALDDYIGWILYALAGDNEETPDPIVAGSIFKHYFPDKTAADNVTPEKFLAIHRIVPTDGPDLGEQFLDQTVTRCQLGFTGGEFVTFQSDFLGKRPTEVEVSGAGWVPTEPGYEPKGKRSVPITALPDGDALQFPVGTSVEGGQVVLVDIVNIPPAYADVAVVGSFDPHSWPILGRAPVVTVRMLYHSSDLYKSAFYDAAGAWDPEQYISSLQISGQSPSYIRGQIDTEQSAPTYETSEVGLGDATQDFTDYEVVPPIDATHWVEVFADAGYTQLQSWAYCGASASAGAKIEVYKDPGCTVRGWKLDGSAGTPLAYYVHSVHRYEIGFKAMNVQWAAAPPVLEGRTLLRVDFTGTLAAADSGLDWHVWLQNRSADYAWPT